MKRKFLGLLLCAAMVGTLAMGCSNKADSGESASGDKEDAASGGGTKKVVLITMDQMDQHWKNVDKGCQEAVKALGDIDYSWSAPDVKDDAKQIECINNAVAGGAEAILLAANGPDAVTAALEEAAAEGVKIIYVDSAANFDGEATFSTDNEAAGVTAGETMLEEFEAQGVTSGKIGIVNVNSATASCVAREEGFRKAFEGTDFELLETQYSEGDAAKSQDIASGYITQGVVGMFGANEGSTVGIGNAIQEESGSKIVGVGFDKSDTIGELVENGYLLATMAQNPDQMGKLGIEAADKLLKGESLDQTDVDTGVSVLKKGDF
ncbi:ribose transport system substrate-binding protein [Aequitasia blattaphilus]|uniref:Substrate-binding domain-containing protein n=1 Tax=Aequitasia blattaphilus TaxID=2949332 RepID=A0ABT1ECJ5_9FIRM|nr:substrate-binding domain-containing protein [Aequitasia blattaphilus]MCP1103374.1 substrate-binding domain-containing protein [Aequitasia blattaphilus]MCR8616014.1 substrate-binding domain-containing protein [Aequitasia blattaphilus]